VQGSCERVQDHGVAEKKTGTASFTLVYNAAYLLISSSLIFYDSVGKGGGVAARAFDHVNDLLRNACNAVEACDCAEGCKNCVQSPSCKEGNKVSSKIGALIVLRGILGIAIDADSIVPQYDVGFETIVVASSVRAVEGIQVEADVP